MPTKKTTTKKITTKKAVPKKAATKKVTAKKALTKKSAVTKTPAKKGATKAPAKKAATKAVKKTAKKAAGKAKKSDATKTAPKKSKAKKESPTKKKVKGAVVEEVSRRVTEALRKRGPKPEEEDSKKGQPVVFSMKDLRDYLKDRKTEPVEPGSISPKKPKKASDTSKQEEVVAPIPARPKQSFGAVSVADLLGFDPTASAAPPKASKSSEDGVPKKFLTYFRALVRLHEEVYEGLHRHSEETLHRSSKEDSGDLSGYGQHMADAGTDSFDRDFALSMVSSEQEALYEIDEAIRRIRNGSYGVCEITGKAISRDRLKAVPFTRYSVEGQTEVERGKKRTIQKAGIQGFDGDDAPVLRDEDADD